MVFALVAHVKSHRHYLRCHTQTHQILYVSCACFNMLVYAEQGPSNESSNFSTMPQLFVFYLCNTTAEGILNGVENTESKQNAGVNMLLEHHLLATAARGL